MDEESVQKNRPKTYDDKGLWFYVLYNGLFDIHPKHTINLPNILVCKHFSKEDYQSEYSKTPKKIFRLFENPEKLFRYSERIDPEQRNFFEVLLGENKVKPYFDIDCDIDETNTSEQVDTYMSMLIDDITSVITSLEIPIENIRWYSSHSDKKRSFHIIVLGYYFENIKDAKRLRDYVEHRVCHPNYIRIDSAVYGSLRQMRLYGSEKPKSNRPKILVKKWKFFGETVKVPKKSEYENFLDSLITWITPQDRLFPEIEFDEDEDVDLNSTDFNPDGEEIPKDILPEVDKLAKKLIGDHYQEAEIDGNKLLYHRLEPSFCPICHSETVDKFADHNQDEQHELIDLFVRIFKFDHEYKAFLYCYNSGRHVKKVKDRRILLGSFTTGFKNWIGLEKHRDLDYSCTAKNVTTKKNQSKKIKEEINEEVDEIESSTGIVKNDDIVKQKRRVNPETKKFKAKLLTTPGSMWEVKTPNNDSAKQLKYIERKNGKRKFPEKATGGQSDKWNFS